MKYGLQEKAINPISQFPPAADRRPPTASNNQSSSRKETVASFIGEILQG